jgi:ribonuclease BN (tRNA processing enzyme)
MKAASVLLTHFSQRYPKFPVLPTDAALDVCVAFDLMRVRRHAVSRFS